MSKKFKVTKEMADEVMKTEGNAKGVVFKIDRKNIIKLGEEEALKKVEERLKELGYPLKYEEIISSEDYKMGYRYLSLLMMKEVLELSDNDIKELGERSVKVSFFIKLFASLFADVETLLNNVDKFWKKHYDKGSLKVDDFDEDKGATLIVKDINLHPVYLKYLEGYSINVVKLVMPDKKVRCRQVKSEKKNEYKLRIEWE